MQHKISSDSKNAQKQSSNYRRQFAKIDLEALIFASKEENQPELTERMLKVLQHTDPEHATPKTAATVAMEMRNDALLRLKELSKANGK